MPGVDTLPATEVTAFSARLNAKVNPKGVEVNECVIEYGRTSAYGSSMPCSPEPGSGTTGVLVSVAVSGLAPDSYYHYTVVAKNINGTARGVDKEFRTLVVPGVDTLPASEVTAFSATLNASVNPKGVEISECVVEYGRTSAYGSSMPCSPEPGSGSTGVLVSVTLSGLVPNRYYHYRVVARSANGTARGTDKEFQTSPSLTSPTTAATR